MLVFNPISGQFDEVGVLNIAKSGSTPLQGAVTLSEGSNITLTQTGQDISIAATGAGLGDVTGPASATDNAITRFDGTTGKLIQNSSATIDDSGNVFGANYTANGSSGNLRLSANTDGAEFNLSSDASGNLAIYGSAGNTLNVDLLDGDLKTGGTVRLTNAGLLQNITSLNGDTIPTSNIVGISDSQALTNKDLTSGTNTFPTFNQNTTGSAATLTTTRTLWGQNFNGSANVSGNMTSVGTINTLTLPSSNFVGLTDAQTLTNKTLTSPKINQILDTNGNTIFGLNPVVSATNYVNISNSTGSPVIAAAGTSTDIGFFLDSKGTGSHTLRDGSSNIRAQFLSGGANYFQFTAAAAAGTPSINMTGSDTNVGLTLVPKGTGKFTVFVSTGQTPTISGSGADTNHNLNLTSKGTGVVQANGVEVVTLSGAQTLTNKTLTSPVISTISNTGTLTLPTSTDTLVGRATTDTLTNKTLTSPVISTITNTGTLTLPTSTDTLVGRATTDTLTNKTITSTTNSVSYATFTNPYKFSVYRNSAWSTPSATSGKVQFDTKTYDTGSNYDNTTNYRFTAPVASFYKFLSFVGFSSSVNNAYLSIYKNGSEIKRGPQIVATNILGATVGATLSLAANDYIEIFLFTASSQTGTTGSIQTWFEGEQMSVT